MSIITISSSNPNLSFILQKNPATILTEKKPFERELRKGRVYGWFSNTENTQFRLMFLDALAENSFGNREEFEYLDLCRYSNPYLPIMMIRTALDSAASKEDPLDTSGFQTKIKFVIEITPGMLHRFQSMQGMNIDYEYISDKHYCIEVTDNGVMRALNSVILICLIASLSDESTDIPLQRDGVLKYLKVLNRANAPYYMRHLFISRAISNRELFAKLEENIHTPTMVFKYGNTQVQRFDAIKKVLNKGQTKTLFDIGCGEMYHSSKLQREYESVIGYDADAEICARNSVRISRKQMENVVCVNQEISASWVIDNKDMFAGNDILASEVLEHMDKVEARLLLQSLLSTDADKVVITLPNKDFNKFYALDETQFRHSDHKWEPTPQELGQFVGGAIVGYENNWTISAEDVGDLVTSEENGLSVANSVSIMMVFTRVRNT